MNQPTTLYKRTSTGAIQYWKVAVAPYDKHEDSPADIIKESGQLGTSSPLVHTETIREGKNIGRSNETTPSEQAYLQAESDWKRKKDSGYKTLEDIGGVQARLTSDSIEYRHKEVIYTSELSLLQAILPKFNTDATGNVLPQLAPSKLWSPSPKNKYPVQGEKKFDGNRTTIVLTTEDTYALTRTGKPQKNLRHLTDILNQASPIEKRTHTIILDGEIYLHGLTLEEINEAIKKTNENSSKLQFVVYDLPLAPGVQEYRTFASKEVVARINSPFFLPSETQILYSDEEVEAYHDEVVEQGYEGIMVKNLEGLYKPGQRNPDWRKVKAFEDNEFEITGHDFGLRGAQDLKFICTCPGGSFEVTMNGTVASKEKLAAIADTLVGEKLTVRHKGYTKYGIPNIAKGKAIRYND